MSEDWRSQPPYTVKCPVCDSQPGLPCYAEYQGRERPTSPHEERVALAERKD